MKKEYFIGDRRKYGITEYNEILTIIKSVSEELKPLLEVKKQIDNKICETHRMVWMKFPQISIQSQNTIIQ